MKKRFMFLSIAALLLTACGGGNDTPKSSEAPLPPEPAGPSVFILTGQSNMEGNTRFTESNLKQVFTDLQITDGDCCFDGIPEVQTSFFGQGYDQIYDENQVHASNTEKGHKIDGKFLDTKVGMGNSDSSIGPELGAAYVLKEVLGEDEPVYFIKCGVSGSGFAQSSSNGDKINWNVEKDENLYINILKPYTQNCLNLIEEAAGAKPVIKGFLWNQGESDAYDGKVELYNERFNQLLGTIKEDFKDYAPDGEGDNIALVDALIYEGTEGQRNYKPVELNDEKLKNIEEHDNYYYVDATEREGALALTMGGDNLHYDLKSMFRLGMAYGQAIIDNGLLD